jgi:hypothetical protein
MAAGMIGAVAVAYGFTGSIPTAPPRPNDAPRRAGRCALLAGIVEVYSSRRRAGEGSEQRQPEQSGTPSAIELPAYDAAREALVAGLIEDALAHEAGRYWKSAGSCRPTRDRVPPGSALEFSPAGRSALLARWTEARDQRWRGNEADRLIAAADWPGFARTIASDLALDRDTMEPAIVSRFAYATPWPVAEPVAASRTTVGRGQRRVAAAAIPTVATQRICRVE